MAEPNDPKDKPKVTLDLNLNEPSRVNNRPKEDSQIKLRPQEIVAKKPEKSPSQTPIKPMRPVTNRTRVKKKSGKNSKPIFILTGVLIVAVFVSQYLMNKDIPALEAPRGATPQMAAKTSKNVPTETLPQSAPPLANVGDPNHSRGQPGSGRAGNR